MTLFGFQDAIMPWHAVLAKLGVEVTKRYYCISMCGENEVVPTEID